MPSLEALAECLHNGIALIRDAATTPLDGLFDPDDAATLRHLATVYFGDTTFSGYQRRAIANAEAQRHSISDLARIEDHTRRLRSQRHAWALREHLCGVPGDAIDTVAKEQLRRFRPAPPPPPVGVTIRRGKDGAPDTLIYRGSSKNVTWLYERLDHPDVDAAAAALLDTAPATDTAHATSHPLGDSRNATPEAAPHIILTLDDVASLQHNTDDVLLTLTNGTRISGAEWAAMRLHEIGFVTLLHPMEGPVNLYRTERFPNMKQRLMAAAESPLCAHPGCRKPASRNQIHHLTAWKHGGETNSTNLTVLCAYHNGINNDDPDCTGRMERRPGGVRWVL